MCSFYTQYTVYNTVEKYKLKCLWQQTTKNTAQWLNLLFIHSKDLVVE